PTRKTARTRCNKHTSRTDYVYRTRRNKRFNKKLPGEQELTESDFTPEKQKEYMDNLIRDLMKDGMNINDIMDMPFTFVMDLTEERNKPKKEQSLISAFSGG